MKYSAEEIERQFAVKTKQGVVSKQDINSYELVEAIMRKGLQDGKVWWFAYELMGFHDLNGTRYFMSYKASTRVSEMSGSEIDSVESRPTDGKLHLYRLK